MATLQKFKFLATQCAVIGSPARSPTTSPVVHIRRRKTLRMLLGKGGGGGSNTNTGAFQRRFLHQYRRDDSHNSPSDHRRIADSKSQETTKPKSSSNLGVRSKLKDLFVSSPPPAAEDEAPSNRLLTDAERSTRGGGGVVHCGGMVVARSGGNGGGGVRPLSATLRQRLLMRRAWRPALVAIPEVSP